MKTKLLFIGTLFFLLLTMPSYAQKTTKKQAENTTKTQKILIKKSQKMEVVTPKQMEQIDPIRNQPRKVEVVPKRVVHGRIDPIIGERTTPVSPKGSYNSITSPESNLAEGEGLNGKITVKGRTTEGHRVEIRVQTGTEDASNFENPDPYFSKIIEDWGPVTVNSEGYWETIIDVGQLSYSAGADWDNDEQHFFTILVRDTNDRSKIEVLHLTRLSN